MFQLLGAGQLALSFPLPIKILDSALSASIFMCAQPREPSNKSDSENFKIMIFRITTFPYLVIIYCGVTFNLLIYF